jgi:RHS repeat-associated protein
MSQPSSAKSMPPQKLQIAAPRRRLRRALAAAALLLAAALAPRLPAQEIAVPHASPTAVTAATGQSRTLLPDGRWLLVGIAAAERAAFIETPDGTTRVLATTPRHPRQGHSATLLPDGRVLILGGLDATGAPVTQPESFNPEHERFQLEPASAGLAGLMPRAHHSATVLSDGRLLITGGVDARGRAVYEAELWNPATQEIERFNARLQSARLKHLAPLLPAGTVLLWGGVTPGGDSVPVGEVYDPAAERFRAIGLAEARALAQSLDSAEPPAIVDSRPAAEALGVPGRAPLMLRFNRRLAVASLNAHSITLIGPTGAEPVKVVPVEQGVLVFIHPLKELLPGSRYTLFVNGAADPAARLLPLAAIGFDTAAKPSAAAPQPTGSAAPRAPSQPGVPPADPAATLAAQLNTLTAAERHAVLRAEATQDAEDWLPGAEHYQGRWHANRRRSPLQDLPALQAPPGVTALAGQVLGLNGRAVAGVTLRIGTREVRSDLTGRFLLTDLPQEGSATLSYAKLEIEGASADRPGHRYGYYAARVPLQRGRTAVLPYTVWMPRLDPAGTLRIAAPTTTETVLRSPRIPGLELRIPAGTVVRDRQGRIVTELNLTAIPVDRPPFPVPDLSVPVYFTVQPGGAVLQSVRGGPAERGARLVYPNFKGEVPGARGVFWDYDPDGREWFVYGLGRISADARQAVPDEGVKIHRFTGAMFNGGNAPPPPGSPPCGSGACCSPGGNGPDDGGGGAGGWASESDAGQGACGHGGDPVSLATGQFEHTERDLAVPDVVPLDVTRTYRSQDKNQRAFGLGMTHPYDVFMYSQNEYQEVDLILPNGTWVHYVRTSAGTGFSDAVFESSAPGRWHRSVLARNTVRGGWDLSFKDGRKWFFLQYQPLSEMTDANGNLTRIVRESSGGLSGKVVRLEGPGGRTIEFGYNGAGFVSTLTDQGGRRFEYGYDSAGRLLEAKDPLGHTRVYTWDTANNRIQSIRDPSGRTLVANEYDAAGRVKAQMLADGSTFQYAYTLDAGGTRIAQTEVTDRRGSVRRVEFDAGGYVVRNTLALGRPEQQVESYEVSAGRMAARTDALGRRTEYAYDAHDNVTKITRLAGTAQAVNTILTYETVFNRPLTVTDPNGHTTTLAYDARGNLTRVTDALGRSTTWAYDAQGKLRTRTDPLGRVATWDYEGPDLSAVTDPLGRQVRYFTDTLGRVVSTLDPLGRRSEQAWDSLNRLLSVTDPQGGVTGFSYDPSGQMLSHSDPLGRATHYTYNGLGKVQAMQDALGGIERTAYEPGGRVRQRIDRKGQLSAVTYDALGRVKTVGFGASEASPAAFKSRVELTWDAGNRLVQIVDKACADPQANPGCASVAESRTITRTYDGLDRLVSEVTPQGEVAYTYDNAGRRTGMTVKNGPPGNQVVQPTVTYTYDAANQLTGITQAAGAINGGQAQAVALAYDAAGRRTRTTLANGSSISYGYDHVDQLTSLVYQRADGTPIGDLTYEYDADGRRGSMGGSLARLNLPAADVLDAQYDANNRLLTWGGRIYQYDANGNLVGDGVSGYEWDERDQLKAIVSGGTRVASFRYDSQGRRTSKTIGSSTTGFVYDGENFVQELFGADHNAGVKAHLITGGIDETFLRLEGNDGANRHSFLSDGNNNTLRLLDGSGNKVVDYTYEPYGATTADAANGNAQQYTGRENDNPGDPNGLMYYRARYYMPGCARFISEDPIGWASGQTNNYAYVGGNPVSLIDPFGLAPNPPPPPPTCISTHNIPVAPAGANVFDNMDLARGIGMPEFIQRVQNNGPWDYKRQGAQYEAFGNFNFGATAWALGIPDGVAQRGAGWYQQHRGAGGGGSTWYGSAPYGDQAVDNQNIVLGQALARDYFSGRCTR